MLMVKKLIQKKLIQKQQLKIKISCSCSAQVSYRKNDTSIEKAVKIFDRLVIATTLHASDFEGCATPIDIIKVEQLFSTDY